MINQKNERHSEFAKEDNNSIGNKSLKVADVFFEIVV